MNKEKKKKIENTEITPLHIVNYLSFYTKWLYFRGRVEVFFIIFWLKIKLLFYRFALCLKNLYFCTLKYINKIFKNGTDKNINRRHGNASESKD